MILTQDCLRHFDDVLLVNAANVTDNGKGITEEFRNKVHLAITLAADQQSLIKTSVQFQADIGIAETFGIIPLVKISLREKIVNVRVYFEIMAASEPE